jgi:hypothetical protein
MASWKTCENLDIAHGKWLFTFQSRVVSIIKLWKNQKLLAPENLETIIFKCEKMPNCGFIHLCAESKGIFLATISRWLAVSADECTFLLVSAAAYIWWFWLRVIAAHVLFVWLGCFDVVCFSVYPKPVPHHH